MFENWTEKYDGDFNDMEEIFLSVADYGLTIDDVRVGNMMSMGNSKIIDDYTEFDMSNILKSLTVKLIFNRDYNRNTNFNFTDEFYNELELTIEHFESRYDCKLSNIFISKNKSVWVKDVDAMREYTKSLSDISISWLSFLDIAFEIK
jgi:hypothetical protein